MRLPKNLGIIVLAIYLILVGLLSYAPGLAQLSQLLPLVALVAGILLLLGR